MPAPAATWNRQRVMGPNLYQQPTALFPPQTPVAATLFTGTSPAFDTDSDMCQFTYSFSVTGIHSGRVNFPQVVDFTTHKYVTWQMTQWFFPFPGGPDVRCDVFANGGISIAFFDSNDNYAEFFIFGSEFENGDQAAGGWAEFGIHGSVAVLPCFLDRNRAPDSSSGVIDWSDISGFEFIYRCVTASDSGQVNIGMMMLCDEIVFTGGDSLTPLDFDSMQGLCEAEFGNYENARLFRGVGGNFAGGVGKTFEPIIPFSIGDGVTETYFRDQNSTIAMYPIANTTYSTLPVFLPDGEDSGITINTSATCNIHCLGTVFSCADVPSGEDYFNVIGNTLGSAVFDNVSFFRKKSMNLGHAELHSCIFNDCEDVEITADTVSTESISRNSSATAEGIRISGDVGDYSHITHTFESNFTGNEITINSGSSGVYDLRGIRTQGQSVNIEYEGSNTITVQLDPSVTATWSSSGGGTVVIDNAVTRDLTLTNLQNGFAFDIYDKDSADPQDMGTLLVHVPSVSGSQYVYSYPSSKAGDEIIIQQLADGYEEMLEEIVLQDNSSSYSVPFQLENSI